MTAKETDSAWVQPVIAPEWVMLTDSEIDKLWYTVHGAGKHSFARAIETAFIAKQGVKP